MTLINRQAIADGRTSAATYSSCMRYRYALTRVWNTGLPRLLYIMLNPSTATEAANDPTIERCERRARHLGYGAFRAVNLFALRETDPQRLKRALHPEGPANAAQITEAVDWADDVLVAWGVHGAHRGQGSCVLRQIAPLGKPLLSLGLTQGGFPRHPLYVSYSTLPAPLPDRVLAKAAVA